jgi:hypothetical protein
MNHSQSWYCFRLSPDLRVCYAREVVQISKRVWRFAAVSGLKPTNISAEHALRHSVTWRPPCTVLDPIMAVALSSVS